MVQELEHVPKQEFKMKKMVGGDCGYNETMLVIVGFLVEEVREVILQMSVCLK